MPILDLALVLIGDSLVESLNSATITIFATQTVYRIAQSVNLHSLKEGTGSNMRNGAWDGWQ